MKKLSESFIDDVIRRSRNMEDREEDSVNLLDREDFYEYLTKRYKSRDYFFGIANSTYCRISTPLMSVGLTSTIGVYLYYDRNNSPEYVMLPSEFFDKYPQIESKLSKFTTSKYGGEGKTLLYQKDGKVTNKFYVDVIDFMIDNIDKPLLKRNDTVSESFIDDVIRRSRNMEDREEDDISHLNRDEFYDWFLSHYEYTDKVIAKLHDAVEKHIVKSEVMTLLAVKHSNHYFRMYLKFNKNGGIKSLHQGFPFVIKPKIDELFGDKFLVTFNQSDYKIEYKDGTLSNKTIVDAIDRLIEVSNKCEYGLQPLLKKRTD